MVSIDLSSFKLSKSFRNGLGAKALGRLIGERDEKWVWN